MGPVAGGHGRELWEVMEGGLLLPGEYKEQMRCRQEALPGAPGENPGIRCDGEGLLPLPYKMCIQLCFPWGGGNFRGPKSSLLTTGFHHVLHA